MAPGNRQPKWNIYEAAILLAAYLEIQSREKPRSYIIKKVSDNLRQMARNNGLCIDEVYRNVNGISYQMQSMESAYKGVKVYVPATKLFIEIVNIYYNDNKRYHSLLREAMSMISCTQTTVGDFKLKSQQIIENDIINFSDIQSLAYTKPIRMTYYGKVFDDLRSWKDAYVKLVGAIYDDYSNVFPVGKSFTGTGRIDFGNKEESTKMVSPKRVFMQMYVETNLGATDLVRKIKGLMNCCDIEYKNITIEFARKEIEHDNCVTINKTTKDQSIEGSQFDENKISEILRKHYQYGFRYNSIREMMRFRQFADEMNVSLPESDNTLKEVILASGTIIEDKLYRKNEDISQELFEIVKELFADGINVIYYENLLKKKEDWMSLHIITSEEMLKEYLQNSIKGCAFSKKFMVKGEKCTERKAVTEEIKRVWGEGQTKSVEALGEALPYIPLGNIWRVISGNDSFVLTSEGEYLLIDRFLISDDEANNIFEFIENACEENGFVSLTDVPLGDIEEENYELRKPAIWNAIYKKVLSDTYHLKGKILTKNQPELDTIELLKQHIRKKNECTFDEVSKKVVELTGSTNRSYVFQALYDEMVRVDKKRFVSTNRVSFDIAEIDRVLDGFVTNNFCSIRDVATFAMFPVCGQNWNHYLLESFCYKYSRKYSLHVINFNDKNSAIIAKKDYNESYYGMLAIALARSNVSLTEKSVGQVLFETGYISKRKFSQLSDIIQKAEELRKER